MCNIWHCVQSKCIVSKWITNHGQQSPKAGHKSKVVLELRIKDLLCSLTVSLRHLDFHWLFCHDAASSSSLSEFSSSNSDPEKESFNFLGTFFFLFCLALESGMSLSLLS